MKLDVGHWQQSVSNFGWNLSDLKAFFGMKQWRYVKQQGVGGFM